MARVHPTAVIDPAAQLADDVVVGPYTIVQGPARLAQGVVVEAHSVLQGRCEIGEGCRIGPAAYVGTPPQHRTISPNIDSQVIVGAGSVIREGVTIHRSIYADRATRVGLNCYLMAGSHVGHDCDVAENVTLANAVLLGGHVSVGAGTFLGGGAGFHQFVRVGRLVMVAGNEPISRDIPPFAAVRYGRLKGYNAVGCKRAGLPAQSVRSIRGVYTTLQRHRTLAAAMAELESSAKTAEVEEILEFIRASKRGIHPSHGGWDRGDDD